VRRAPPANRALLAVERASFDDGLIELGLRPVNVVEARVSFGAEGADDQPLVDETQTIDGRPSTPWVTAACARMCGEEAGVSTCCGVELRGLRCVDERPFHVLWVGAAPQTPDVPHRRVARGA